MKRAAKHVWCIIRLWDVVYHCMFVKMPEGMMPRRRLLDGVLKQ